MNQKLYRSWLCDGLPDGLSHYEVLQLPAFENDQATIHSAWQAAAAVVQGYELRYPEETADLQAVLSTAYDCLRDASRKRAYDRQLAGTKADRDAAPGVSPAPEPSPTVDEASLTAAEDLWAAELPAPPPARVLTAADTLPRPLASPRKTRGQRLGLSWPSVRWEFLGLSAIQWLSGLGVLLALGMLGYSVVLGLTTKPYYTTTQFVEYLGPRGWIVEIHNTPVGTIEARVAKARAYQIGSTTAIERFNEFTSEDTVRSGDRQVHYEIRWTRDAGFVKVQVDGADVPRAFWQPQSD